MNLTKSVKKAFLFLTIVVSISCSQKGVFLPVESDYAAKVRAILDTTRTFSDPNYPILLTDKPPFEKAVYRDSREFNILMMDVFSTLDCQFWTQRWLLQAPPEPMSNEEGEKGYMIIFCDDDYIYSGVIREKDSVLYAKYNPITKDNKDMYPTVKTKNMNKFYYWIMQEMNKGAIISVTGTQKVYFAKSFDKN